MISRSARAAALFAVSTILTSAFGDVGTDAFRDAHWIGGKGRFFHWKHRADVHPAPVFRRRFVLEDLPAEATLFVSAAGYRSVRINGREATDDVLMPTPSNFDRRVYYSDYSVGGLLTPGTNVVEVTLGNSIYNCGAQGAWMQDTITWRDAPQVLLRIADGTGRTLVRTDENWETYTDGPVRSDSIRNGETFDARKKELGGPWSAAVRSHGPGGVLAHENHPPTRILDKLRMSRLSDAVWDAGECLAGFAEIEVCGERGATVTIRYRERIGPDGKLPEEKGMVESGAFQTDTYVLAGGKTERWHPQFVYHGFRYLSVSVSGRADVVSVMACRVGTDVKSHGDFSTSCTALEEIHRRMRRSLRANLVGYPTDCPTREKQGWTGDALYACEAMLYNFDAACVYVDWLRTLVDVQRPNGQLPAKSPISANGYNWGYGPAWDAALVLIPEAVYDFTGDDSAFREFYPAMVRYLNFADGMLTDGIAENFGLGDWLAPGKTAPDALVSTAYLFRMYGTMSRFAERFGREDDRSRFVSRAGRIARDWRRKWCRGGGHVAEDELTSLAVAALFRIGAEPEKSAVLLADGLKRNGYKADFGMIGSMAVPRALAEFGMADAAVRMFEQADFPGWEWQRTRGATTIWEDWAGGKSRDHVIFGDPSAWAFRYLGGFVWRDGQLTCEPVCPESIRHFRASQGEKTVEWSWEDGKLTRLR